MSARGAAMQGCRRRADPGASVAHQHAWTAGSITIRSTGRRGTHRMRGPRKRRHSEGQAGRPLSRSLSSSTKARHATNRRFQKLVVNQVENGQRHHHLPLFGGSLLLAVCFRTFSSGRENGFVGAAVTESRAWAVFVGSRWLGASRDWVCG